MLAHFQNYNQLLAASSYIMAVHGSTGSSVQPSLLSYVVQVRTYVDESDENFYVIKRKINATVYEGFRMKENTSHFFFF